MGGTARAAAGAVARRTAASTTASTTASTARRDIERLRVACRRLVRRRAAVSAGVSTLSLPGVVVKSELALFALTIADVERAFGFTPAQAARLRPALRLSAYRAAAGLGGMLAAGLTGRPARPGLRLGGAIAAAALRFAVFLRFGDQHVEACAALARRLIAGS